MNDDSDVALIMYMMLVMIMLAMFTQQDVDETANLSGHVRDSGGSPISEVQLALDSLTYTTGADGFYGFTGLTPGTLVLRVVNAEDLGYEYKPPISLIVAAGMNTRDITLTAPTTKANLSGTVRDYTTLEPIPGVTITLNSHETTTNIFGMYSFHDIELGDYTLTVSKDGYDTKTGGVTLLAGDNTLDIILVLEGVPAAEFEVSDLSIVPAALNVGETVEISASVTNVGDAAGTCVVSCYVEPGTYTPLEVAVPAIPWGATISTVINAAIIIVFITTLIKMVKE